MDHTCACDLCAILEQTTLLPDFPCTTIRQLISDMMLEDDYWRSVEQWVERRGGLPRIIKHVKCSHPLASHAVLFFLATILDKTIIIYFANEQWAEKRVYRPKPVILGNSFQDDLREIRFRMEAVQQNTFRAVVTNTLRNPSNPGRGFLIYPAESIAQPIMIQVEEEALPMLEDV